MKASNRRLLFTLLFIITVVFAFGFYYNQDISHGIRFGIIGVLIFVLWSLSFYDLDDD